ncbi:hypothetical protein B0T18DRAFT_374432 [Schizothecium vesticola]|uniref:Uncharacterized protein n=1 Tax=Schizothecium vesticola TaxID=314040 RepID=A0AA40EKS1_9PEZI|nr:hypothetical protein B0T18DRAFT_374432 [Schizothecium vesticola]
MTAGVAAAVAPAASTNTGETASTTAGLFCAYCGKQFTRKEHLERHLPNHTNVKPHRCAFCQLSFSRRDLLVRHHTTYHEARDNNEPATGRIASVAGRTPIACQNCATAKTGCDKRTPCTRCTEKGLDCEARYARRSGKTAARQAQARTDHQEQLVKSPTQLSQPVSPSLTETAPSGACKAERPKSPAKNSIMSPDGLPAQLASPHLNMTPGSFPSPHQHLGSLDDFGAVGDMAAFQDYAGSTHWTSFEPLGYFPELQPYGDDMTIDHHDLIHGLNEDPSDHHDLMQGLNEDPSDLSGTPQLTPGSYSASEHTRDTSICSPRETDACTLVVEHNIPEFDEVKAAEDGWNLARCNPPMRMADCPSTSLVHLESLESMCKNEGSWGNLESYIQRVDWDAADLASVAPLSSRTRETMLVITQTFLHKALDNHRDNHRGRGRGRGSYSSISRDPSPGEFNFIVLPPSEILEYFLRSYVRSLSLYYPLIVAGKVDPNDLMQSTQTSTLLMLLMIAQGAAATPVTEARYLSAGLTETCRISLGHIQNLELKKDPITLRCALLFIVLGVWSGDKWLMDYAMGQRSMYMDMVKDAGMLNPQPARQTAADNKESLWHDWVDREGQNRLVYNYVMLDQELCLFYDTGPRFAINQLECPLPASEHLWMARNADEWLAVQAELARVPSAAQKLPMQPPVTQSLRQLFDDFVNDTLGPQELNLSPQQLRLLLYPLQTLISDQRQLVRSMMNRPLRSSLQAAAEQQMIQLEQLLTKWYILARNQLTYDDNCPVTRCNMALFHLISMNSEVDFSEIEKLARRDKFDGSDSELWLSQKRRFSDRVHTLYNAGQVLRWLRVMPRDRRPAWWSLAMYRVTLVIWADSLLRLDPHFQLNKPAGVGPVDPLIPIDLAPIVDNDTLIKGLKGEFGTPVLTLPSGLQIGLDKPVDVLAYGIKSIEDGSSTRLGDGIVRKLIKLAENWSIVTGPVPR